MCGKWIDVCIMHIALHTQWMFATKVFEWIKIHRMADVMCYALAGVTECISNWPSMSVTMHCACVRACVCAVPSHRKSLNTCNLLRIRMHFIFLKPLRDLIVSTALHIWFIFVWHSLCAVLFTCHRLYFFLLWCCCCCCFWLFAILFWLPKWPLYSLILFIYI